MALAAALALAAKRLLRGGGLQPLRPVATVPALSLRVNRQLCDAPAADEPSDPEEDELWKESEAEMLRDVGPVVEIVKNALHSGRYGHGGFLSPEDQEVVIEKLLSHHPRSEEKIGCGVNAIMVGKHPDHERSRCLFVLRTNGDLEDFSYRKCLRAYLEQMYPSHADRFLQKLVFQRRPS